MFLFFIFFQNLEPSAQITHRDGWQIYVRGVGRDGAAVDAISDTRWHHSSTDRAPVTKTGRCQFDSGWCYTRLLTRFKVREHIETLFRGDAVFHAHHGFRKTVSVYAKFGSGSSVTKMALVPTDITRKVHDEKRRHTRTAAAAAAPHFFSGRRRPTRTALRARPVTWPHRWSERACRATAPCGEESNRTS